MPDPVTVLARAHVAGRVERLAAERARRPPLQDDLNRPARERAGRVGRDPNPEHGRAVIGDVISQRLEWLPPFLLSFHEHALAPVIPPQRHRATTEVLPEPQGHASTTSPAPRA